MVEYIGIRRQNGCEVYRAEYRGSGIIRRSPLPTRSDLQDYAPGFDWGHDCDEALQLALAILSDHTRDDARALQFHQSYKNLVVLELSVDFWRLSAKDVESTLCSLQS